MDAPGTAVQQPAITPDTVIDCIWEFVCELHPHLKRRGRPGLDSSLDTDLALDSLTRMELLARLERCFQVRLPEQLMTQAETPRDLLRGLLSASTSGEEQRSLARVAHTGLDTEDKPESARTLLEVLDWHVRQHPDRVHVHYYDEDDQSTALTFAELRSGAERVAAGLRDAGLEAGQTVAIMLPSGLEYFFSFLGVLIAGGIPVPIYPPMRMSQMEEHVGRHAKILDNAQTSVLITFDQVKPVARLLRAQVATLRHISTVGELKRTGGNVIAAPVKAEDIAFIQYTSGSTGSPKGVVLTHQNILANIRAMDRALEATTSDVFVSWLPLYHDMGLIGAWMGSLYVGFTLVLMSPLSFLGRPVRWLEAIHKHRGTVSGGPNFGFELCLQRIEDTELEGLDLSCWRLAFNGAEPVSADTMRRFHARFADHGLPESALAPVYGLAEVTLGLGFPPAGRGLLVDRVQREPLALEGRAVPAADDDDNALEVVACGQPMPGYQARVVDAAGRELPERHQGRLEFKGPSTTSGYYRNPEATATLFDGDWVDSGDLAYIAGGDIFITSREKDMIIRGGRNIYPYELEDAAGDLDGIRKGCVAVFAGKDQRTGTERLVVVAETRETDPQRRDALVDRINELAVSVIGMPTDDVVLAAPRTVLKTSSGKIRRSATAELYNNNKLNPAGSGMAVQMARLLAVSIGPQLRYWRRRLVEYAAACWTWLVVTGLTVLAAIGVWLTPKLESRWKMVRRLGQLAITFTGVRVAVHGLEHLPRERAFVLVSNHQSYLDGPLLSVFLPVTISYVIKGELRSAPLLGGFLKRLGLAFVERFDRERSLQDARAISERLTTGRPIGYFPEGTLQRMPGLLPFHMGAFVAAAEANVPVVPVTIQGTRSVLRDGSWFPRLGSIRISIDAPVTPAGGLEDESEQFREAVRLRDETRKIMLARCGEPDLVEHRVERTQTNT